jgi:hypothetical protein
MPQAAAAPAKPATSAVQTDYMVLQQVTVDGKKSWVEAGETSASSRLAAAQAIANDKEGIWRPVPMRSWQKAIKTKTVTTTRTKVEEVDD